MLFDNPFVMLYFSLSNVMQIMGVLSNYLLKYIKKIIYNKWLDMVKNSVIIVINIEF